MSARHWAFITIEYFPPIIGKISHLTCLFYSELVALQLTINAQLNSYRISSQTNVQTILITSPNIKMDKIRSLARLKYQNIINLSD